MLDAGVSNDAGEVQRDVDIEQEAPAEDGSDQVVDLDAPLAEQNGFGPAGRMVTMIVPEAPDQARRDGCIIYGEKVGTGLSSLLQLAGGLDNFLVPGGDGQIPLLMMVQMIGWESGQGSGSLDALDLVFFQGTVGEEGEFLIAPVEGDPEREAGTVFSGALVDEGWVETDQQDLGLTVPFLDIPISLNLVATKVTGRVYSDGPGAGMRKGVLTGYMDVAGAIELVSDIQAGCASENPPAICPAINNVIPLDRPAEESLDAIVTFAGGFDTRMESGFPYPCDPSVDDIEGGCNAIGLCILVEMDGIVISGVAEP